MKLAVIGAGSTYTPEVVAGSVAHERMRASVRGGLVADEIT